MTEIDFGTTAAALIRELEYIESNLTTTERHDTRAALQAYQGAAVNVLRAIFDEAEQERRVAESAEDKRCPRCGDTCPDWSNVCGKCRMPLSEEGRRAVVREVIGSGSVAGGLSAEEIDRFVRQMEKSDPDVFAAALKVYVDATASLCKAR